MALAEIVAGAVNPSGHTVDTWPSDLTADPTFPNAITQTHTNTSFEAHTLEYEEGIYVGYRWYETAAAEGVLIDYVKTDLLQPGETKAYTISFLPEALASYDYKGAGCYVLEAGVMPSRHILETVVKCGWPKTRCSI